MGFADGLGQGMLVALDPVNLMYVLIGVVIGTVVGVLPGLGPTATITLLLPLTYSLDPAGAIIMLAGIYYGTMYGGTITSVLLALPGEPASVVTVIDGHQMAKQGRAGAALGIAAIGSFVGGTLAVVGLTLVAAPLTGLAVKFGSPEYVALAVLGLLLVSYLGQGAPVKNMCVAALGLALATIGLDPIEGTSRFTFNNPSLFEGFDFVVVAMGLFGVAEILRNLEESDAGQRVMAKVTGILPSKDDLRVSFPSMLRGSLIGFFIGCLPGGSGTVSALASYGAERRFAKDKTRFGRGAIEGVAGPETANNAAATSAFIPLLTLGIPASGVMALIYGALLLQGVVPGPALVRDHSDMFWAIIASMYIGNVILVVLNIPLIGIFIQVLRVRVSIISAFALVVSMAGVYSLGNDPFDLAALLFFGVVGWLMIKTGLERAPLVLAFILGPILEAAFRQSMIMSDGSLTIFVTRPYSGSMFAAMAFGLVLLAVTARRRKAAAQRIASEAERLTQDAD